MIITTSNVMLNINPTVTTGVSTDLPANIVNPDFSAVYVGTNNQTLTIDFGGLPTINYVALAGLDIQGDKSGSSFVRLLDGNTVIATINVTSNQVVVFSFNNRVFNNMRITLNNGALNKPPMVAFVAGGTAITIPNNGENAGYNRQFLARNFANKTTINNKAQPISQVRKRKQARGRLPLPNLTKSFSETTWQTFLDFAEENHFFIVEQLTVSTDEFSGTNPSAYLCYDLGANSVKAHDQTRELNNASIDFMVLNGL